MNDVTIPYKERCNLSEDYMLRKDILRQYNIKQLKGDTDHRYYAVINGKKTKKFTRKRDLEDYLIEHHKQQFDNLCTLRDIYPKYIESRRIGKSCGTFKKDIKIYKTYIENSSVADIPIKELTYDDGIVWYKECQNIYHAKHHENMKKKYFDNIKGTINTMFTYAKVKRIISENPFAALEIHQDNFTPALRKSDEITIYTDEEKDAVKKMAYQLASETQEGKYLAPIIFFNLGIRDGELLALKWSDIIDESHIHIQNEFVENCDDDGKSIGMKFVQHTKTMKGDRVLKLNSEVIKVLNTIKKYNLKNGYGIAEDDFIFMRKYRNEICPLTPRTIYTLIEKICRRVGMNEIKSAHDMRRTCFTNLFYAGMPIKDIQAFAGHEDVRMTEAYIKKKPSKDDNKYLEAII